MRRLLYGMAFLTGVLFLGHFACAAERLSAEFTQTKTLSGFSKPLESRGTVVIYSDLGLIWQQLTPFESKIKISENAVSSRASDGPQEVVPISFGVDSYSIPQLIQAVFTGNDTILQTQFHVKKEMLSGGKTRFTIVPKKKEGFHLFLSANVLKAADVERVEFTDAAHNKTTILFTNTRHTHLEQSEANREFQDR